MIEKALKNNIIALYEVQASVSPNSGILQLLNPSIPKVRYISLIMAMI